MKRIRKMFMLLFACLIISMMAIPISVNAAVKLNKTNITLEVQKKYTLKVSGTKNRISWSSSNKKVASVSSNGVVKGIKKGTCTITAKYGTKKLVCKVTVKNRKIDWAKMCSQYKKLILKNKDAWGGYGQFVIYDANKDKIPELYILNVNNGRFYVYSFAKNKLKRIGSFLEGLYLYSNPDGNGIVNATAETIAVFKVTNDSVTRIKRYEFCHKFTSKIRYEKWCKASKKYKNRKNFLGRDSIYCKTVEECLNAFNNQMAKYKK